MTLEQQSLQKLIAQSRTTRGRVLELCDLIADGNGGSDQARELAQQISPEAFQQQRQYKRKGRAA
ncbi:MAG: hypothetical protein AAF773_00185 [Cyanobacteria bacterium P01_D01_bin.115]